MNSCADCLAESALMGETEGATAMALAVASAIPDIKMERADRYASLTMRLYAHSQDDALRMAGESLNRVVTTRDTEAR